MSDAREEAERRYNPDKTFGLLPQGFVAGAEWQAAQPITGAQVEAAANAIYYTSLNDTTYPSDVEWALLSDKENGLYRVIARAALEAAREV